MEIKHDSLWFCEDCFFVSETGNTSGLSESVDIDAIWAGVERLQKKYEGRLISNNDCNTDEGIIDFTWNKTCSCCHSNLGGRFYRMSIIG
jgi:hypothetical protein